MKHLPLLLTICFLPVLSGKEVNNDDLIERNGLWYEKFTSVPFTGSVYAEYAGGKRVKNGEIVNGLREGPWEKYWENGQLSVKISYKEGKPDGVPEIYSENGQIKSKSNYQDSERDDPWEIYDLEGQFKSEGTHDDGPFEEYYKNGKLFKKYFVKDGNMKDLMKSITRTGS